MVQNYTKLILNEFNLIILRHPILIKLFRVQYKQEIGRAFLFVRVFCIIQLKITKKIAKQKLGLQKTVLIMNGHSSMINSNLE